MKARHLIPLFLTSSIILGCGDNNTPVVSNPTQEATTNNITDITQSQELDDINYDTNELTTRIVVRIFDEYGNRAIDKLVCFTAQKNAQTCAQAVLSTRTNQNGEATFELNRHLLNDYHLLAHNPVLNKFQELSIALAPKISITEGTITEQYNIEVNVFKNLAQLYSKLIKVNYREAGQELAKIMGVDPEEFFGPNNLDNTKVVFYSKIIAALNVDWERLNRLIFKSYLENMIPTIEEIKKGDVSDFKLLLALKKLNNFNRFPSVIEINQELDNLKNLTPPKAREQFTINEFIAKSSIAKSIEVKGNTIKLRSRMNITPKNVSSRAKKKFNEEAFDIKDAYVWILPSGRTIHGKFNEITIDENDGINRIDIDTMACINDTIGKLCAIDIVEPLVFDDETVTDSQMHNFFSNVKLTHHVIKKHSNGATTVEFTITSPKTLNELGDLFNAEITYGDSVDRQDRVDLSQDSFNIIHTYAPGLLRARAKLTTSSTVTTRHSNRKLSLESQNNVDLTKSEVMPSHSKLIAEAASGCGSDRNRFFFKIVDGDTNEYIQTKPNGVRISWKLGSNIYNTFKLNEPIDLKINQAGFLRNRGIWNEYTAKVQIGQETYNYKLSNVIPKPNNLCDSLDVFTLDLANVNENGFDAQANYAFFEAYDKNVKTRWFVDGTRIMPSTDNDRFLTLSNLECGSTHTIKVMGKLNDKIRSWTQKVTLDPCGSAFKEKENIKELLRNIDFTYAIKESKKSYNFSDKEVIISMVNDSLLSQISQEDLENISIAIDYDDGFNEFIPLANSFSHQFLVAGTYNLEIVINYGSNKYRKELKVTYK